MRPLPKFESVAFLAPMAGVSDPALRLVCKELGAGLVVTEFINIHAIVAKQKTGPIQEFIEYSNKERPLSCQVWGTDLDQLEKAVKIVSPHFDIIDYNMGCPAPHITKTQACSALLTEPRLVRKIFQVLVKSTDKPVSVKIRSGVSSPDRYLEIGKIAEEEGLSMITLHPRTVKQGYSGKSDWSLIKKLKESVSIAVCGNGDITSPEDAKKMLEQTGCDYVMIGRAACSNPFLFAQINNYLKTGTYGGITDRRRVKKFFDYLKYAEHYKINTSNIRMQAMNFTKGCKGSKELRGKLLECKDIESIRLKVEEIMENL